MTVSAQSPINRSTGNGVTTVFPYTFKIISAADIEVSIDDVVKVLNVDYTVTGAGTDAGGNVTMTTAPANGTSVVRRRNMALTRTTDYQDQGTLPAATLDNDIDNVVLMVQQVDEQIGRAMTAPASLAGFDGQLPAPVGNYILGIKPDGSGFQYYGPTDNTLLTAALASSSGASLVGFLQPGTGAVASTVQTQLHALPRFPENDGAVGDGVTVDTVALQKTLDNAAGVQHIFLGPKTYVTGPLTIPSNTVIHFHPLTILKAVTGYGVNDRLMTMAGASNVTIWGNGAQVKMLKAEYVSGEQRHGVMIYDCEDVNIYNLFSNDSGGDGFYVGGNTWSTNVNLICCGGDNNRRQGLSIVSCDGFLDFHGTWTNTVGTAPECGIDIEPNTSANRLKNIEIVSPRTSGNSGSGVLVVPGGLALTTENTISVKITGHVSYGDGYGSANIAAATFTSTNVATLPNKLNGRVSYTNFTHDAPAKSGIRINYWDATNAPFLDIGDGDITNVCTSGIGAAIEKSPVIVWGGAGSLVTSIGNFRVRDIRIKDTRGTATTYTGVYLYNNTSPFSNYEVIDVTCYGFTPTSGTPTVQLGTSTNSLIRWTKENVIQVGSSRNVAQYSGQTIEFTAACALTLPTASLVLGQEYIFRNTINGNAQIRPATGDTILQYGLAANNDLIMSVVGDYVKLRSVAAGSWQVEMITDKAKRATGFGVPGAVVWGTAEPASGTWVRGDVCYNTLPAAAGVPGWVCTTAGTPGTWKAMAALAA